MFNISELKRINGVVLKKIKILKIVSKTTTKVGVFIYIITINKKFFHSDFLYYLVQKSYKIWFYYIMKEKRKIKLVKSFLHVKRISLFFFSQKCLENSKMDKKNVQFSFL
jgi:hypothetical protein